MLNAIKHITNILACVFVVLASVNISQAEGWRGITPLHSTRADVERLIGPPTKSGGSDYSLTDEHVVILYTDGSCNFPPDTVITITVAPGKEQRLSSLGFDLRKFRVIQDKGSHTPGIIYYVNDEDGVSVESREGLDIVLAVTYGRTSKEGKELRCSKPSGGKSGKPTRKKQ